jgi:predicted transcriptional regulator
VRQQECECRSLISDERGLVTSHNSRSSTKKKKKKKKKNNEKLCWAETFGYPDGYGIPGSEKIVIIIKIRKIRKIAVDRVCDRLLISFSVLYVFFLIF